MGKFVIVFVLSMGFLAAQVPAPAPNPVPAFRGFPVELQMFLELTPQQVDRINRLNRDFLAVAARKNLRSAQVQREIFEWTNAEQIVPIELGLRYAELEQIRREIRGEEGRTRSAVQAVLTDAQRAKLRVIEEAAKLQPLIGQAIGQRLIEPLPLTPGGIVRPAPQNPDTPR